MSNHTIVIPTADLEAATAFYQHGVGRRAAHRDALLRRVQPRRPGDRRSNPNGARDGMTGPVVYWTTSTTSPPKVAEVEAAGGTVVRPDHGGRRRDVAGAADRPGRQPGRLHHPGASSGVVSSRARRRCRPRGRGARCSSAR